MHKYSHSADLHAERAVDAAQALVRRGHAPQRLVRLGDLLRAHALLPHVVLRQGIAPVGGESGGVGDRVSQMVFHGAQRVLTLL